MKYKWKYRKKEPVKEIPAFFQKYYISDELAGILLNRNIRKEEDLVHFLYDDLSNLADPFLMKGLEQAVDRLLRAVQVREKIVIYGDYDVDGITSTSILYRCLAGLGADVGFYIPKRESEGYGLNEAALNKLAEEKFTLLVTVDCGISSADLIAKAPAGLDIIVTDHHMPPKDLPRCVSVVNPHQEGCKYPFKELAGCGVIYTVCRGLYLKKFGRDYTENVELAALGTIADVVSLTGENRILVREGMKRFLITPIKGLSELLKVSGIVKEDTQRIQKADQVSFGLAPRLNAAGRIADAGMGVRLLITESQEEATALAENLCEVNVQRQQIEHDIYDQAVQRIEELNAGQDMALVVDGKDWHPGVIGIVASRILEKYHRPVLVLTIRDGVGKGSCRSIPAFDIYKALQEHSELLLQYGGHKMAAGFSIKEENIPAFREALNQYAESVLTEEDCIPALEVEDEIPLEKVTVDFIKSLELLEPCGCDNPRPLFSSSHLFIETTRRMGADNRHFKCHVAGTDSDADAIFWGVGAQTPCFPGDSVDIVYDPEIHDWYGEHVQLIGKDIRQNSHRELTREFLVEVYRRINLMLKSSPKPVRDVHALLQGKYGFEQMPLYTALAVFEELGILLRYTRNGEEFYQKRIIEGKLDLKDSAVFRRNML